MQEKNDEKREKVMEMTLDELNEYIRRYGSQVSIRINLGDYGGDNDE